MKTANTDAEKKRCPVCGAFLSADAPQGLCGACLLAGAAAPTDHTTAVSTGPRTVPSVERVAAAFPQLEIIGLIGVGGMGAVYKARQTRLDRFVALKILSDSHAASPAFAERFNREALALARLNHPNIVTVYDYGQSGGLFYLLMEYVDGVNLRQAMKAGSFTPQQALGLVPKVCDALQFAHDEGILHRDIKPENLLLDRRGRVKIADFGIAKLVGCKDRPVTLTASGAALGTPAYMAPEQLEKPAEVDHRADIYSLGVVFYEMLTGELPLGRFEPPSKKTPIDERVDEIVLRALAKDKELRQQSAGEMKTEVEEITPPGPTSTRKAVETPPGSPPESAFPRGAVAGDFVLLNPQLPRMARAITLYAVLVAPLLWLLGVLLSPPEIRPIHLSAFAVQQCTLVIFGLGRFLGVVSLAVGGFRLRGLRPDALRWIRLGLWLHLGMLAVRGVGLTWADALDRRVGLPELTPWVMVSAVLGFGSLAWEIASLVWLHRFAPVLHPLLGLPAPCSVAPHATVAVLWTAASLAIAGVVTGVFLAAPQVAAWQLGEPFPLYQLGEPASPGGLLLLGLILTGVMACAVKGMQAGWRTLREIRARQGETGGIRRAVFGATAWPTLLAMGAATVGGTIALLQSSRGGFAAVALSGVISLTLGELVIGAIWRWATRGAGNRSPVRVPWWVHRWVLGAQLAAIAIFVPIVTLLLPAEGLTGLRVPTSAYELEAGMSGGAGAVGAGSNRTGRAPRGAAGSKVAGFAATALPGEYLNVKAVVLSNGVPVDVGNLSTRLPPASGRGSSPYRITWQRIEAADTALDGTPWEILIENETSGTVAARLRPLNLPHMDWTGDATAKNVDQPVTRQVGGFEVARALQATAGGNAGVADWSVRLQLQSTPVSPGTARRAAQAN